MATHSSILAQRIPGTEEPFGLRLQGHTELDMTDLAVSRQINKQNRKIKSKPQCIQEFSMQFTLEQCRSGQCGPTYTWTFSIVNIIVLQNLRFIESTDAELWLQSTCRETHYKLHIYFQLCGGSAPLIPALSRVQLYFICLCHLKSVENFVDHSINGIGNTGSHLK